MNSNDKRQLVAQAIERLKEIGEWDGVTYDEKLSAILSALGPVATPPVEGEDAAILYRAANALANQGASKCAREVRDVALRLGAATPTPPADKQDGDALNSSDVEALLDDWKAQSTEHHLKSQDKNWADWVREGHAGYARGLDSALCDLSAAINAAKRAAPAPSEPDEAVAEVVSCRPDNYSSNHRIRWLTQDVLRSGTKFYTHPQTEPAQGWRCFHCDEFFADREAAALHFGTHERHSPACTIDAAEYRAMEARMERYIDEDAEIHRHMRGQQAEHAAALRRAEETGYARALKDTGYAEPAPDHIPDAGKMAGPAPAVGWEAVACKVCDGTGRRPLPSSDFQDDAVSVADIAGRLIEMAGNYEFEDDSTYTPTERERVLLTDFATGITEDEMFMSICKAYFAPWRIDPPAPQGDARDAERWRHIEPQLGVEWDQDEQLGTWAWVGITEGSIPVPGSTQYTSPGDAIDAAIAAQAAKDPTHD